MRLPTCLLRVVVTALVAGLAVASATGIGTGSGSYFAQAATDARTLDLVWISDSSGWGAASFYAREISRDLGVRVRVHDLWKDGLSAADVLWYLRNSLTEWIPAVRDAEVIVVYGNPAGLGDPNVNRGYCTLVMSPHPPAVFKPSAKYIATLEAIYKRIFAIRKGAPVILRTYNTYVPVVAQAPPKAVGDIPPISWKQAGIVEQCTKAQEVYTRAIATAAAAYHVPVADTYKAFNGKNHRQDPVAKGYIQPDGIHPSNAGRAVIASTLANLGYKQVKPPTD